jgi:acetylornithine deacetylase/succinyl-diaminopimelate desuccinylase-like protein
VQAVLDRLAGPPDEAVRQLVDYVRRPSISATGEGVRDTAGYIAERMNRWGIEATVLETAGLPAVLGRTPPRPPEPGRGEPRPEREPGAGPLPERHATSAAILGHLPGRAAGVN